MRILMERESVRVMPLENAKYILPIIVYLGGVGLSIVVIVVIMSDKAFHSFNVIPPVGAFLAFFLGARAGKNPVLELVFVYLLMPIIILPIGLILDRAMARVFVLFHKVLTFKKCDYRIVAEVQDYRRTSQSLISRTIIPAFLSLALGFLLVQAIPDTTFYKVPTLPVATYAVIDWVPRFQAIFVASVLMLPLSYLLSSALWLLEDAGVTFLQRQKAERQSINVQGVNRYFNTSLRGFISISTLFSMIVYFGEGTSSAINSQRLDGFLVLLSISIPLLLIAMLIPATLLHEARASKDVPKLLQGLRQHGVDEFNGSELSRYFPGAP
jgi:hypothetical protein